MICADRAGNSRVGVWDRNQNLLSGRIQLVGAIREDDLCGPVGVRALLDSPVNEQLEVPVALDGPQVPVSGLGVRIAVDDPIHDTPVVIA